MKWGYSGLWVLEQCHELTKTETSQLYEVDSCSPANQRGVWPEGIFILQYLFSFLPEVAPDFIWDLPLHFTPCGVSGAGDKT